MRRRVTAMLAAALSALTVGVAHTAPPEAVARWREGLAPALPEACIDVLERFLKPLGGEPFSPPPGKPNERSAALSDPGLLSRLNRQGGLPFYSTRGTFARYSSEYDTSTGTWAPRSKDGLANRGVFELDLADHRLVGFDHVASPVTSATTLWEDRRGRVALVAHFPGSVEAVEDRGDRVVLHVEDAMSAVGVAWDKASARLVGTCLIDAQAAAALSGPADLLGAVPTAFRLTRTAALHLQDPAGAPEAPWVMARVAAGTQGLVLLERPGGWALVLVPSRDRSPAARLFKGPRTWVLGWLPAEARPAP